MMSGRSGVLRRIAIAVVGLAAIAITPKFALAFYPAYGADFGETPPEWLDAIEWIEWISIADPIAQYHVYGSIWAVLVGLLVVLTTMRTRALLHPRFGLRLGTWAVLGGLGLVAAGALLEYAVAYYFEPALVGFGLELLGFLVVIIGPPMAAIIERMGQRCSTWAAIAWAPAGLVAVAIGAAAFNHIPSGLAIVPIAAVTTWGVLSRSRDAQVNLPV